MQSSSEANLTPENQENPQAVQPIALAGLRKAVLDIRVGLAEGRIDYLEREKERLGVSTSVLKNTARSVLIPGRPDYETVIADPDEWEQTGAPSLLPLERHPGESDADYQERQIKRQERLDDVGPKLRTEKHDRKTAASELFTEDRLIERTPDPDEEGTSVVKENGKVDELFVAKSPVTRKERRAARRHYKQRKQNLMKAASAEGLRASFGDHRINPNNESYDASLSKDRLTFGAKKKVRQARRFQAQNIKTFDRNKSQIQQTARGEGKYSGGVKRTLSKLDKSSEKTDQKLQSLRNRREEFQQRLDERQRKLWNTGTSTDTMSSSQLAIDHANRELVNMSPEEIKQTLRKRYYARMIGEVPVAGESDSEREERVETSIIEEVMANLSDTEKEQLKNALSI